MNKIGSCVVICVAVAFFASGCERRTTVVDIRMDGTPTVIVKEDPWKDPVIGPIPPNKLKVEEFANGTVYYLEREYHKLMPESMDTVTYAGPAYVEVRNVRFRGMLNDFDTARMRADTVTACLRDLPDGRKNIARVVLRGKPVFVDDRNQKASGPLEIDIEASSFTSNGRHKAPTPK